MSNELDKPQRMLGDASDQFTVTMLSDDEKNTLERYINKNLNRNLPHEKNDYSLHGQSHYVLGDSMTGDRYFVASALQLNDSIWGSDGTIERTMDITPVVVQVKGGKIINADDTGNKAALEKLGIDEGFMPNLSRVPLIKREEDGSTVNGYDISINIVHPKRLAALIDEGLTVGLENQKPLSTAEADSRQKLRGQVLLQEKLADEHQALMSKIRYEDTTIASDSRPIASQLYQNTFEQEGYTLNKNNELVAPADSKRIQNATYSALPAGKFMNLGDINGEFLLGKPDDSLQSFIRERAEQNNEGDLIDARVIKHKSSENQTVLYGLAKPESGTGFFNAVTLNGDGMVVAQGSEAMAGVGIKAGNLNQGQLWSKLDASGSAESNDNISQQQQFMAQINADNIRRAVSKKQIIEHKMSIHEAPSINDFEAIMDSEKQGVEVEHFLDGGESRSAPERVEKLKSELLAVRTFEDRFTLTSIRDEDELEAVAKIIAVNSETYENIDGVEDRVVVGAIKMQEHWSDNSSEIANPGKVDRVRLLVQVRADNANFTNPDAGSVSANFSTTVHTFDDGVYTGSFKPESDPEMGMRLDRSIKDSDRTSDYDYDYDSKYGVMLINQQAVFDAVIKSFNTVERNSEETLKLKAENGVEGYSQTIKEIDRINTVANGESQREQDQREYYEREEGYHLSEQAEWEEEQRSNEESSRLAERIFDDFNPYEPGWQEQIEQADIEQAARDQAGKERETEAQDPPTTSLEDLPEGPSPRRFRR